MRRAKPRIDLGTEQARRVIYMYNKFLEGNSYSSAEMYDEIIKVFKVNLSLRTVQRDLRTLHDMASNMEQVNIGRQVYWRLAKTALTPKYLGEFDSGDLLNLHYLKAHLQLLENSPLEKEVEKLLKRIEHLAPGDAFIKESFSMINEWGQVDYKNYSSVFEELVNSIVDKKWVNITYSEMFETEIRHQFAMFKGFFTYHNSIFFVAFVPRKHSYVCIPLENISKVTPALPYNEYVPEFKPQEFFGNRIGVSNGELVVAELLFKGEFAKIFGYRKFNPKQITTTDEQGNVKISFNVILNTELINWILGFGSNVQVLAPLELIDKVKTEHQAALNRYQ
jgi:predicted DNA-binding transcriptional regulator YafY